MRDHTNRSTFRGLSKTRLATVVVALVLAVSGCSGSVTPGMQGTAMPGTAATVNGEAITDAFLAETVADLSAFSEASPASVLQALIVAPFWIEAAAEAGYGSSEDEAAAFLAELAEDNGLDPPTTPAGPGLITIARVTVSQNKASESGDRVAIDAVVNERVRTAEILVNPRYGEWVQDKGIQSVPEPWSTTTP